MSVSHRTRRLGQRPNIHKAFTVLSWQTWHCYWLQSFLHVLMHVLLNLGPLTCACHRCSTTLQQHAATEPSQPAVKTIEHTAYIVDTCDHRMGKKMLQLLDLGAQLSTRHKAPPCCMPTHHLVCLPVDCLPDIPIGPVSQLLDDLVPVCSTAEDLLC